MTHELKSFLANLNIYFQESFETAKHFQKPFILPDKTSSEQQFFAWKHKTYNLDTSADDLGHTVQRKPPLVSSCSLPMHFFTSFTLCCFS